MPKPTRSLMTDPIEVNGRWWRPSITQRISVPIRDQPRRFFRWLMRKPLVEDFDYTLSIWTDAKCPVGVSIHFSTMSLTAAPVTFTRHTLPSGQEAFQVEGGSMPSRFIPTTGFKPKDKPND